MRVSFPDTPIFLALADIKACFRYPRIPSRFNRCLWFLGWQSVLLGHGYGFWVKYLSCILGTIPQSYCRSFKTFSNRPDLVKTHKLYIYMLKWDMPSNPVNKPVKAFKCPLNPGVIDDLGNQLYHPSRIWVDDSLIAAVGVENMKMALVAIIEAIFAVLGSPKIEKMQYPLAIDK